MTAGRDRFSTLTDPECISLLTRDHHGSAIVVLGDGQRVPVTYELVEGVVTFAARDGRLGVDADVGVVCFEIERYDDQIDCVCQISVVGRAVVLDAPASDPEQADADVRIGLWYLEPHRVTGTRGPTPG